MRRPKPFVGRRSDTPLVQAESFRILRSNLLVALSDVRTASVFVTSARASEGKTSVTVNLAASLAAAGLRVCVVDFDLRKPTLHRWFNVSNETGATEVLLGRRRLEECLHLLEVDTAVSEVRGKLQLLTAGPAVEQPTELLSGGGASRLLDQLINRGGQRSRIGTAAIDIALIDTPPVLPVADALVVGRIATGGLLVAEADSTPSNAVRDAKDALIRAQARLLGVVLNGRTPRAGAATGYGYGYGYE